MVEIDDVEENPFIDEITKDRLTGLEDDPFDYAHGFLSYIPNNSKVHDGGGADYIWTGGTDDESEGLWKWTNSVATVKINNPFMGSEME